RTRYPAARRAGGVVRRERPGRRTTRSDNRLAIVNLRYGLWQGQGRAAWGSMRLFVGGQAWTVQGEPDDLGGDRIEWFGARLTGSRRQTFPAQDRTRPPSADPPEPVRHRPSWHRPSSAPDTLEHSPG